MKLLTYDTGNGPRCGVIRDNQVVDVSGLLATPQSLPDVRALLELGDSALDWVRDAPELRTAAPALPLECLRLRSPIL